MNDVELQALTMLVYAEVEAMKAMNSDRMRNGLSLAYTDAMFTGLDCVKRLEKELKDRAILKAANPEKEEKIDGSQTNGMDL